MQPRPRRHRILIAACLAFAGLGQPASAEQWWTTPNTAGSGQVQADVQSLHCDAGVCEVMRRTLPAADDAEGARSRMDKVQYDCVRLRERPAQAADGQGWSKVEADSVGEALLTFACTFGSRPDDTVAAGRLNADGREFVRLDKADVKARPVRAPRPVSRPPEQPEPAASSQPQGSKLAARDADGPSLSLQIASSPSRAAAQAVLDRLSKIGLAGPGELLAIESASVSGRPVFRIVIDGVRSEVEAQRLCASAKAAGYGCLVRSRR